MRWPPGWMEESAELLRREVSLQQQLDFRERRIGGLGAAEPGADGLQLEGLRGEKLRLEVRQRELEQEWDGGRNRVAQMEDHLRMGRQSLQELREQRNHAEIGRARNDSDRQHLRETCMTEVNAQPEDLIATETAFMSGEELATAEASYREMKERIESMGAVNMMALEEFNDAISDLRFLTRERDDLMQSILDTNKPSRSWTRPPKKSLSMRFMPSTKAFPKRSTPFLAAAWRRCA